jgi:hypothetical protein
MMAFERSKRDAVYTLMERCIDPKELSELDYFA